VAIAPVPRAGSDPREGLTRRGRALLAGTVCAVGALVAHGLAGGHAPAGWLLVLLPASVATAALVVRREGDVAATAAAALLTQVGWHALLLMYSPASHGGSDPAVMALGHLLVAAATAAVVLGAERTLVRLLVDHVVRLRPLPQTVTVPARRPGVVPVARTVVASGRRPSGAHEVRGPPPAVPRPA
jgi:hypothetical protein